MLQKPKGLVTKVAKTTCVVDTVGDMSRRGKMETCTLDLGEQRKKWACTTKELHKSLDELDICAPAQVIEQFLNSNRKEGFYTLRWSGSAYNNLKTFKSAGIKANAETDEDLFGVHRTMEMIMKVYTFFTMKGCTVSIKGSEFIIDSVPEIIIESGEYLREISGGRKIIVDVQDLFEYDPVRMLQSLAKAIDNDMYFLIAVDHYENEDLEHEEEGQDEVGETRWDDIKKVISQLNGENKDYITRYYQSPPFIPQDYFSRQIKDSDWGVMTILFMYYELGEALEKKFKEKEKPKEENMSVIDTVEKYLQTDYGPHEADAVADILGIDKATVTTNLCRLVDKKLVFKEGRGLYYHRKWLAYDDYKPPKKEVGRDVNHYM